MDGAGVQVSMCLLGNYYGTQAKAAEAVEDSAYQAYQAYEGIIEAATNESEWVHIRPCRIEKIACCWDNYRPESYAS